MVIEAGCGGKTLGPPIFAESRPEAAQGGVADHLGFQAETRAAGEQRVLRIFAPAARASRDDACR